MFFFILNVSCMQSERFVVSLSLKDHSEQLPGLKVCSGPCMTIVLSDLKRKKNLQLSN